MVYSNSFNFDGFDVAKEQGPNPNDIKSTKKMSEVVGIDEDGFEIYDNWGDKQGWIFWELQPAESGAENNEDDETEGDPIEEETPEEEEETPEPVEIGLAKYLRNCPDTVVETEEDVLDDLVAEEDLFVNTTNNDPTNFEQFQGDINPVDLTTGLDQVQILEPESGVDSDQEDVIDSINPVKKIGVWTQACSVRFTETGLLPLVNFGGVDTSFKPKILGDLPGHNNFASVYPNDEIRIGDVGILTSAVNHAQVFYLYHPTYSLDRVKDEILSGEPATESPAEKIFSELAAALDLTLQDLMCRLKCIIECPCSCDTEEEDIIDDDVPEEDQGEEPPIGDDGPDEPATPPQFPDPPAQINVIEFLRKLGGGEAPPRQMIFDPNANNGLGEYSHTDDRGFVSRLKRKADGTWEGLKSGIYAGTLPQLSPIGTLNLQVKIDDIVAVEYRA